MVFISTKNMKNIDAPEGVVLVKYLEPSWGGWYCEYAMAYFDNPNDYENPNDASGWLHNVTNNKINVVSYCELPKIDQEKENPFNKLTQRNISEQFGTFTPKLGCIGK